MNLIVNKEINVVRIYNTQLRQKFPYAKKKRILIKMKKHYQATTE